MRKIRQPKHGPEWFVQRDLITFLKCREWHVERVIGNALQMGLPDLYVAHKRWGTRWIDCKRADSKYSFTKAQKRKWPVLDAFGVGIWILTAATQTEYDKLFKPANWRDYAKSTWKIPTREEIDQMLDELDNEEAR